MNSLTKLHAQRVLLGTRLELDMWEEAVNFVWFIRQHTVTSPDSSTVRTRSVVVWGVAM